MPGWYVCRRFQNLRATRSSAPEPHIEGPFSTEEIEAALAQGQLTLIDQIFDSRFSKWSTIGEIEAFSRLLERSNLSPESRPKWVTFKPEKKSEVKKGMEGLLTTEEIKKRLQSGELSYSHLVWCEGMSGWARIGDVEDFSRHHFGARVARENFRPFHQEFPDLPSAEELLANVMTLSRAPVFFNFGNPFAEDAKPEDACGEDLTGGVSAWSGAEVL